MKITNKHNIDLPMAMFLVNDDYDLIKENNYISVTGLLKPIKAIILNSRIEASAPDVLDFVASRVGTSIHNYFEAAWLNGKHIINMKKLGYPDNIINKIKINPNNPDKNDFPVYLEQRVIKTIHGYKIGGKYDLILENTIHDVKSVKAFSVMKNDTTDYKLQMSIYKWLNQDKVTENFGKILFLVTDFKQFEADAKPNYPQLPILTKKIPLMSIEETEAWINNKLHAIESLIDADQSLLPDCTNKELWQDPTKYAYFKNPTGKRATKVFDTADLANIKLMSDGSVGKIEVRPGKPKRCNYCSVKESCHQAQAFSAQGLL